MYRFLTPFLFLIPTHATADQLQVATSFTIIADMARNVGGHLAEVRSITPPGRRSTTINPARATSSASPMRTWCWSTG
ncbi:hypothetical protein [Paracoccus marcusii]|uniref:hypothetical protein n=1 Tax=Paracoccus marcusii TaxID=59779 RepID=UPI0039C890B6